MVSIINVIDENGDLVAIEVSSEDVRAQILATREMTNAIKKLNSIVRIK
jgi:hypothetical protein